MREEIGEVVGFELTDPRLESVVVTDVKVSDDLRDAKVFVIVTGTEKEIAAAMRALQNASVFVRQQVAMNLSLRHVPLLNFARDTAEENAARINEIITTLKNSGELGAEASETE